MGVVIFYGTPADPHLWPAITAATLLAGLAVTADADDKAALTRALVDPDEACHGCGQQMTEDDQPSYFGDTCRTCVDECLCFVCSETRWQVAEDRAEQAAFDAVREAGA